MLSLFLGAVTVAVPLGCKNNKRNESPAAAWLHSPKAGVSHDSIVEFPDLGVKFETPDTLYVFKDCGEAGHSPEGEHKWVPVVICRSGQGGSGSDEDEEDPYAASELEEESGVESIALTIYATEKSRPLDERAVSWFENQYKQAGLIVDEISFQHSYQKKSGIYAKLHVVEEGAPAPSREIVQFMFPRGDAVFIARMEYPFGETRSVEQDWKYILWNFDFIEPPK